MHYMCTYYIKGILLIFNINIILIYIYIFIEREREEEYSTLGKRKLCQSCHKDNFKMSFASPWLLINP